MCVLNLNPHKKHAYYTKRLWIPNELSNHLFYAGNSSSLTWTECLQVSSPSPLFSAVSWRNPCRCFGWSSPYSLCKSGPQHTVLVVWQVEGLPRTSWHPSPSSLSPPAVLQAFLWKSVTIFYFLFLYIYGESIEFCHNFRVWFLRFYVLMFV